MLDTVDGPVPVNEWFVDHPELILGEPAFGGAYRADDLRVTGVLDPARLDAVLAAEAAAAAARGQRHDPLTTADAARHGAAGSSSATSTCPAASRASIVALPDGSIRRGSPAGRWSRSSARRRHAGSSASCAVCVTCSPSCSTCRRPPSTTSASASCNTNSAVRYDAYTARFGPLNRYTWGRTGRTDPDTGDRDHAPSAPEDGRLP